MAPQGPRTGQTSNLDMPWGAYDIAGNFQCVHGPRSIFVYSDAISDLECVSCAITGCGWGVRNYPSWMMGVVLAQRNAEAVSWTQPRGYSKQAVYVVAPCFRAKSVCSFAQCVFIKMGGQFAQRVSWATRWHASSDNLILRRAWAVVRRHVGHNPTQS